MTHALFISDLHLRHAADGRMGPVLDFLRTRAPAADTLYLVGDVFDFWLGWRSVSLRPYFPILRALAERVEAGQRVVIFSGNHDPDPGDMLADLGLEVHERPLVESIAGQTVRIEHGDTVDPRGLHKRAICALARSRPIRAAARLVHPGVALRLAEFYSGHIHDPEYDQPLPRGLTERYFPRQVRAGTDVLVMGHYHRAVHHRAVIDGRPAAYFVLGDWVAHRTYLRCLDGEWTLLRYHPDGDTPIPEGDHPPAVI